MSGFYDPKSVYVARLADPAQSVRSVHCPCLATPASDYFIVWPVPAATAVTLNWCADATAQPVVLKGTSIAWV